jgi:hypothetical protein
MSPFFNLGARWEESGQGQAPTTLFPGMARYTSLQETGWAPGLVCTCMENLAPPPTGIRSPATRPIANRYTDSAIPLQTDTLNISPNLTL